MRRLIAVWMVLGAPAGWSSAADPAAPTAPKLPEPIHTRQSTFTIPFQIGQSKSAAKQPAEVLLHLSADQGASWQVADRVKPPQHSFYYRAPHDGEYQFAISTLAQKGEPASGPFRPELRVIVDTVPPRLDFAATRQASGEVVARWQAVDPNLRPESLQIEYQNSPGQPWEPLAVDPPLGAFQSTLSGEQTWFPKPGVGPAAIRAKVLDRAGNPQLSQVQLGVPGSTSSPPSGAAAAAAKPLAAAAPSSDAPAQRWPADRTSRDPFLRGGNPPGPPVQSPPAVAGGGDESTWRASTVQRGGAPASDLPMVTYPPGRVPATPAAFQMNTDADRLDFGAVPPGQRVRMVNATTFELEYEVDGIGPTGIARVEVWGTRDGGRTWSSFGVDNDNRSPVAVRVDREGVYGLSVAFQTGNGFGGTPPRSGDQPEIWIGVDLTKPAARISGTELGREVGDLVVRYEAADGQPEPRPISLFYRAGAAEAWQPIAAGLENSGSYTWRLDNRIPERVYLRLEARDEAGNVGAYETPEPVRIERQRPQGRIIGVRPVSP